MNRQEFFRRLEYLLRGIPEHDRMDALAYYNDYFDEAGLENEQQVIRELGSPEQVAQTILEDYHRNQQSYGDYGSPEMEYDHAYTQREYTSSEYSDERYSQEGYQQENKKTMLARVKGMSNASKILLIIIIVLTFPIWIGVVAGIFGGVIGLFGGLFGTIVGLGGAGIGLLAGGIVCLVVGIMRLCVTPVEGIVTIGVGALLSAISVLLVLLVVLLLFQWLPAFVKTIVKWVKGLWNRQKGGDEI